jgi:hypothetical protein
VRAPLLCISLLHQKKKKREKKCAPMRLDPYQYKVANPLFSTVRFFLL